MCFMAWLYELISIGSALISPLLNKYGFHNIHFIDAIVMFLVIPFLHLMNDEDTKGIICEENWYQGVRNMLGIYKEKVPQGNIRRTPSVANSKRNPLPSDKENLTDVIPTNSFQNRFLTRRCNSVSTIVASQTLAATERNDLLQRRYSLPYNITEQISTSSQNPITRYLITSIKAKIPNTTTTMSQSNYSYERYSKGSLTSLQTIYLDS